MARRDANHLGPVPGHAVDGVLAILSGTLGLRGVQIAPSSPSCDCTRGVWLASSIDTLPPVQETTSSAELSPEGQ